LPAFFQGLIKLFPDNQFFEHIDIRAFNGEDVHAIVKVAKVEGLAVMAAADAYCFAVNQLAYQVGNMDIGTGGFVRVQFKGKYPV
jgi:hypothetical protein